MLTKLLETIRPLDENAMESARLHWDAIAKPLHSLGRLEDMIVQLAGICENPVPAPRKKAVLIFCADNGIVAEGVTQTTQDVTAAVTQNFAKGIASVNALSRICGAEVFPVDIGVAQALDCPGVLNRKVAFGTQNFAHGPAMRRDEAEQAVCTGIDLVQEKAAEGYNLIVTGEMGIGNTTTSSAVFSVLQGLPPEQVTGRGAGLSDAGLQHKIQVISRAVAALQPDPGDVLDVRRVRRLRHDGRISGRSDLPGASAGGWIHFRSCGKLRRPALPGVPGLYLRLPLFQGASRKNGAGRTASACLSGL
mgnify:CR=1 FL=1